MADVANKGEALRCVEIGKEKMQSGDLAGAEKFLQKSMKLFPTDEVSGWRAIFPEGGHISSSAAQTSIPHDGGCMVLYIPCRLGSCLQARMSIMHLERKKSSGSASTSSANGTGSANGRAHASGPSGMGKAPELRNRHRQAVPPQEEAKENDQDDQVRVFVSPFYCAGEGFRLVVHAATPLTAPRRTPSDGHAHGSVLCTWAWSYQVPISSCVDPSCACCACFALVQATPEQRQLVASILATKNYYQVLSVEKGANDDDIKRAYRKLALKLHPGTWGEQEGGWLCS
jgi:hypothetical protein